MLPLHAFAHDDVVERQHVEHALAAAVDLGLEQHAVFGHVLAVEDRADRLEHRVERDVGEKAEPALVHADQRDLVRRERARDVEHRAVAAEDDRQIGARAQLFEREHGIRAFADMRRGQPVEHDLNAALLAGSARARAAGPAISGLLYLPMSATVLKGVFIARIKPYRTLRREAARGACKPQFVFCV